MEKKSSSVYWSKLSMFNLISKNNKKLFLYKFFKLTIYEDASHNFKKIEVISQITKK